MNDAIPLGRPAGIPVRLHATWFLVAGLVVWSLAASYFPQAVPGYSEAAYWGVAIAGALLFFASLLAHEMAHAITARSRGLEVADITLYLFGGVAAIKSDTESAADEFWVAVVGPLTSFGLAGLFALLWLAVGDVSALLGAMLGYLALINLILALFNILPGFPLDGGRLLRAAIWWRTGNADKATRWAAGAGIALGYVLVAVGIFRAFGGFWLNGLWLVFLGWYLQSMADRYRRETTSRALFADLRVTDLVNTEPVAVAPTTSLEQVVHNVMLRESVRAVPVLDDDRFLGLLTLNRIGAVPREEWPMTTAADAMIPEAELHAVRLEDPVEEAIALMREHDVNQLPVLRNGQFVGLLSRSTIIRHLEIRRSLPDVSPPRARQAA